MLDIQSFNNAIKAKWIQRYLDPRSDKGKWKLFTAGVPDYGSCLQIFFLEITMQRHFS